MRSVAVLMGGVSSEREISLKSGQAIVAALREASLQVTPIVLNSARLEVLPEGIEAVFIALHGGYGENGGVQADLDRMGVPYTGPGAAACKVTMDKAATKRVLEAVGVPVPAYEVLTSDAERVNLPLPIVVKPPRDGSSVGVSKVERLENLATAIRAARALDAAGEALVEEYIPGREWTVGIVNGEALPVVEIRAPGGWYGFQEKYTAGVTEYIFPDDKEDAPLIAKCQALALVSFVATGCRGMARVDFRVTSQGQPFVLELNTVPGFTATSLLPKAAARQGVDFKRLCLNLLASARFG